MIGADRLHKGQRYTCVASVPFTRKDGTVSAVLTWQSECAECGEAFKMTTPAGSEKFEPNRRCLKHKRPGHRVKAGVSS